MKTYNIVLLPGDGVGPEVLGGARAALAAVGERAGFSCAFETHLIGGAAIDACADPLPRETLSACLKADAVLLGAVGGPKWDGGKRRPEEGLLGIRKALGLFANLRPISVHPAVANLTPLKPEIVAGVDLIFFRELAGGAYYGEKRREGDTASDLCIYSAPEIERIARPAFDAARQRRGKVTSVDKANVMESSRLWRETVTRLHGESYADVELEHQLVDSMAMHLIRQPRNYDVILTENMFGDILSDEASVLSGSLGLSGSASLGSPGPGLYEPIHGSAPDIAGKDIANPIGAVLSAAMLLRFSLGLNEAAAMIERAVSAALSDGCRTADIGGAMGCAAMGQAIAERIRAA